ncbi:conserved hypothetical protein [Streptomyces sp. SPB78]|nr:conserved hypothetical protein [Streptomyces sp. SPB78]
MIGGGDSTNRPTGNGSDGFSLTFLPAISNSGITRCDVMCSLS